MPSLDFQSKQYLGQQRALEMIRARYARGRKGTLLDMYMGTGKSRVAIEWLKETTAYALKEGRTPVIILACPLALLPDPKAASPGGWHGEIEKWWSHSAVNFYASTKGTTLQRAHQIKDLCKLHRKDFKRVPLIIAQSYESWREPALSRIAAAITNTKEFYRFGLLDESHRVKSPSAKQAQFARVISAKCDNTLLLTGTPMPHSPLDIWSQFNCIDPFLFGPSFYGFRNKYAIMKSLGDDSKIRMFVGMKRDMLQEFREKFALGAYSLSLEDALDLPPITHVYRNVTLTSSEYAAYGEMDKFLHAKLMEEGDNRLLEDILEMGWREVSAPNVLAKLMKLSQMTGGAVRLENGDTVRIDRKGRLSSKGQEVLEILSDIDPNEPAVIFCRFRADMDICHEVCAKLERQSYELSGRRKQTEQWRSDTGGSVIIVQQQSGGEGVDLTRAHFAIFYSILPGMGKYDQSVSRFHRAGQTYPVTAIHLVASGTVDERIRNGIDRQRFAVDMVKGGSLDLDEAIEVALDGLDN